MIKNFLNEKINEFVQYFSEFIIGVVGDGAQAQLGFLQPTLM